MADRTSQVRDRVLLVPKDLRLLALGQALSALLLIPAWAHVLPGPQDYFRHAPRAPSLYLSLVLLMVLLGLVFTWIGVWAGRKGRSRAVRVLAGGAMVCATVVGLNGLLLQGHASLGWPRLRPVVPLVVLLFAGAAAVVPFSRCRRLRERVVAGTCAGLLLVAPLPLFYVGAGAVHALDSGDARVAALGARPADGEAADRRVVWVVFDEFDWSLSRTAQRGGLALPNLELLMAEGIAFDHARAAGTATVRSVPGMTVGARVAEAEPLSARDLRLTFTNGTTLPWSTSESIFRTADEEGLRVGVVGVHHPYCRVFAGRLATCLSADLRPPEPQGLKDQWMAHLGAVVPSLPVPAWRHLGDTDEGVGAAQAEHAEVHGRLVDAAQTLVARDDLDLVYLHLNVPHPAARPSRGFYDAEEDAFTTGAGTDYGDNLVLADRTLGALRQAMEKAQVWNDTTLVVTSDHGYRTHLWGDPVVEGRTVEDFRTSHWVPLVIHPAATWSGSRGDIGSDEVQATRVGPLVMALARDQVHDFDDVLRILQEANGRTDRGTGRPRALGVGALLEPARRRGNSRTTRRCSCPGSTRPRGMVPPLRRCSRRSRRRGLRSG